MNALNPQDISIYDVPLSIRTLNTLLNLHEYGCRKQPIVPCQTLGDVAKLSQAEILRTPNCGKVTLKEIEDVLAKHGLSLKDMRLQPEKTVVPTTASIIRNKELEETNERLLRELGYLQGEIAKVNLYKDQIAKLEQRIVYLETSNNKAWETVRQCFT